MSAAADHPHKPLRRPLDKGLLLFAPTVTIVAAAEFIMWVMDGIRL